MPTKKSTKAQKTRSAGKQKEAAEILDKRPAQLRPPIVVGGGGSVYVWIRKNTLPQLVDPASPPDHPLFPNDYVCFKCDATITTIAAQDGHPGPGHGPVSPPGLGGKVHPQNHRTVFDDQ